MDKPIRILQVFNKMDKGGAETFIMNVYRNIDRAKIQFDFAVHSLDKGAYDNEIRALGGNIYHFDYWNGLNLLHYKRQWKVFFREHHEFECVHGHIGSLAYFYLGIAKKFGIKTALHCHGYANKENIVKRLRTYLIRKAGNIVDYRLTCSLYSGHSVYDDKLFSQNKVMLVANGINVNEFKFDSNSRKTIREEFHIADTDFLIGHVGRFVPVKNHKFTIQIFSTIKSINARAKLMLVGDGALHSEIQEKIDELGLHNDVILTGIRDDISALESAMDVVVLPSFSEGLSLSLVEAQASGLPCVVSTANSREVDLIGKMKFLSLDTPPNVWADAVLEAKSDDEREIYSDIVKSKGYDIQTSVNLLQNFYMDMRR